MVVGREKGQPVSDADEVADLRRRTGSDVEKIEIIASGSPCRSFDNIARHGQGRAPQLRLQPEAFGQGKLLC